MAIFGVVVAQDDKVELYYFKTIAALYILLTAEDQTSPE